MVDIKEIRANPGRYEQAAQDKGIEINISELLEIDKRRSDLLQKIEGIRHQRNELDDKIKTSDSNKRGDFITENKKLKAHLADLEPDLKETDRRYQELMMLVPLPQSPDTPVGKDESANKEIAKVGEPPQFDFKFRDHVELGKRLDIIDMDSGVKISGNRGYVLKNEGVLLQLGVLWHALKKMISKGFTPVIPPTLIREFALFGSGHFPFDTDNIYRVIEQEHLNEVRKSDPLFLAGTSEPALLAMHSGKTFEEKDLPITVTGFSPCYRSEVGSYGKDTKGLYRVREFWKVEQVVICRNDPAESEKWLNELRNISEDILQDLDLPYRVVQNATGDMGAGKFKMFDIETWMPSRQAYGETHSDSNLHDWQARRLKIRYKNNEGKTEFCHTLNNTGIASPRILIPLLENHQQADGSVKIPKVLRPYLDTSQLKPKV